MQRIWLMDNWVEQLMILKPQIRPFAQGEWHTYKDLRLRALADSPDAFGSTLASEQDRTDAEWAGRLAQNDDVAWNLPLMAVVDGEPAGLAWGRIEPSAPAVANLYQMWVAPEYRRLGAGQMLLEAVIAWATAKTAAYLDLDVTFRDSPAMRLYTRLGFRPAGPLKPLRPGSQMLEQPMRLQLRKEPP
jgi:GNAT superfamily N-acetyltransferase